MYDCYTGFKWIASVIRELEGTARYLGGGEESYGFLAEDFARDKDSVSAISLMAEICAWAKDRGMDFGEMLQDIYVQNGYSHEDVHVDHDILTVNAHSYTIITAHKAKK